MLAPTARPRYTTVSSVEHISAPHRTYRSVCIADGALHVTEAVVDQLLLAKQTAEAGPDLVKPGEQAKEHVEPNLFPLVQLTEPLPMLAGVAHEIDPFGWAQTAHGSSAYCAYPSNALPALCSRSSTGVSREACALLALSLAVNVHPAPTPPLH